jgi:Xaa-Pro dipeptidase
MHRTGHGLGLDVHEAPYIAADQEAPLPAGCVFTVEPGVYVKGLGGVRIEDDVVLTAGGHEILTQSPRELVVL